MHIGEVHETVPIIFGHIVLPGSYVVSDRTHDRLAHTGHFVGSESVCAEQSVDRRGMFAAEKFAARVGPQILFRARNIYRSGRDERDEHMLIDRQLIFVAIVFPEVAAEPVGKTCVDPLHRFPEIAL